MTEQDRPTRVYYWAALTLAALAVRILVVLVLFGAWKQQSDALMYAAQARRLLEGGGWDLPFFWPVGRSLALLPFLGVFGTSEAVIKANSIAIDVGCVLMAAVLAHQVLWRRSIARLAGWLAAFYPPMVLCSGWSDTSNLTMLALLSFASLGLLAYRKQGKWLLALAAWFASGCCLGFAMLTQPSSASFFIVGTCAGVGLLLMRLLKPAWAIKFKRLPWKTVLLSSVGFLCGLWYVINPILMHNVALGAGWVLSTNNERNFFLGNNPYTPLYKTWHWGQHPLPEPLTAYFSSFQKRGNPRWAMVQEAVRHIIQRPDLFLLRTVNRVRAFWGFDYRVAARIKDERPDLSKIALFTLLSVEAGGYCLLMPFVLGGLFLFPRFMEGKDVGMLLALVLTYMLPYAIAFACGTYHFPVMGFLFPFAAVGVYEACKGRNSGWLELLRKKWFGVAIAFFVVIQLEYGIQISRYYSFNPL